MQNEKCYIDNYRMAISIIMVKFCMDLQNIRRVDC